MGTPNNTNEDEQKVLVAVSQELEDNASILGQIWIGKKIDA